MSIITYTPLIKHRGFDPSPVVNYGIPKFANSRENPKVWGTVDWEDWWDEQIDRCINGYTTGGIHIPGRYYYYLNFCLLNTIKRGYHYPDYIDFDLEFFRLIDTAKEEHKGVIVPKPRRRGVSYKMSSVLDHGLMFTPSGYVAGVVAGEKKHAEGFYTKFKQNLTRKHPEFFLHHLSDSRDKWEAGYELRVNGVFQKQGSFNTIFCRTAKANENVFKGEMLNDCVFEEAGEFSNLAKTYGATRACFVDGTDMVGTPYIYGTGGKMSSAKDFKSMFESALKIDFIPMEFLGQRMVRKYYIGSMNRQNVIEENCPNIEKEYGHLSREQILGCEDVKAAELWILKRKKELQQVPERQPYYDFLQDYPMSLREMFLNFSGNPFSPEKIADQSYEIGLLIEPRYKNVVFEYKKTIVGETEIVDKETVVWRLATQNEIDRNEYVMMLEEALGDGFSNYDVAGIDSYDLDETRTSKSLGAMVVVRRKDRYTGLATKRPICLVRMRPKRREIFYEMCLKVAIYYNLKRNVLGDVANYEIGKYFIANKGEKYLAERPKSFENKNSEQIHKYWVKLTVSSKPEMVGLMQTWVEDFMSECWFPIIIAELSDYDIHQSDSDWDAADALGIALMRISDMRARPESDEDAGDAADFGSPQWKEVNGRMVDTSVDMNKVAKPDKPAPVQNWSNSGVDVSDEQVDNYPIGNF